MTIAPPIGSTPIVKEDNTMEEPFRIFINEVANLSALIGSGSPEGVVEAIQWREYIDQTASSGSIKYIKKYANISGDKTKGWVLI